MAGTAIKILIAADAREALATLKETGVAVGDLNKKSSTMGHVSSAASKIAAGGFAALAIGAVASVKSAIEAQQSQVQLNSALKNTGISTKANREALNSYADAQAKFGVSTSQAKTYLAGFVTSTGSAKKATTELTAAENLAAGQHESLSAAVSQLTRMNTGSTRALTAAGIAYVPVTTAVDKLKAKYKDLGLTTAKMTADQLKHYNAQMLAAKLQDKQINATRIQTLVNKKYGDDAARQSKTLAGQWAGAQAKFQNLQEEVGRKLLPVITKLFSFMTGHVGVLLVVAAGITAIWAASVLWTVSIKAWSAATKAATAAQWLWNAAMDANPISLVIIALVALGVGLYEAYKHVKVFRDIVNAAFNAVKRVVTDAMPAIERVVKAGWNYVKNVFNAFRAYVGAWINLIGDILHGRWSAIWSDVKNIVLKGINLVRAYVGKVPGYISSVVGSAAHAAASLGNGILNGIVNGVKSVPGRVSSLLGQIPGFLSSLAGRAGSAAAGIGRAIYNAIVGALSGLGGAIRSEISSALSSLPGGSAVQSALGHLGLAGGTNYWRGGVTLVGEEGPEIVNLPRGAQVIPAHRTAAILSGAGGGGGGGVTINIFGADLSDRRTQEKVARQIGSVIDRQSNRKRGA